MTTPILGEQFIRTLRHYLETNEHRLLSTPPSLISPQLSIIKEEPVNEPGIFKTVTSLFSNASSRPSNNSPPSLNSSTNKPSSLYGIPVPYMSLLAATSPEATALSLVPYMPLRSTLTLDIHYLYFLLVQFEYLGLEESHLPVPDNGLVETETTQTAGQAPSVISSVGSVMSTLSLSTGWHFWNQNQPQNKTRPLHEDIVWIHKYVSRVSALKLHMNLSTDLQKGVTRSSQRTIRGYEVPVPLDGSLKLSLKAFKKLEFLELSNVPPLLVDDFDQLRESLVSLVIKSGNVDNGADVIGDTRWNKLKMLSLADNSLTTLEAEPAQHIRTVTHLNLSSNLLIDIPVALASLYNLSCLNLSHNMISYTTGINTVLGNIQELDLRGNRLTVLAGLDRLWALERLDVRDNRIDDATEIGRLTSLPNIHDVWIEGNPFTTMQTDYRVEIFSLFKKNDLDIQLDGTKPSFTERHRIHIPNETKFMPTLPGSLDATKKWPSAKHVLKTHKSAEDINTAGTEIAAQSPIAKTKKIARAKTKMNKRQIPLGQVAEDLIEPPPAAAAAAEEAAMVNALSDDEIRNKFVHRLAELEEAVQQENVKSRRATSIRSRRSKKASAAEEKKTILAAAKAAAEETGSPDAFRKKIEAMRKEAGTEWLRVLQEMDIVKTSNSATTNNGSVGTQRQ